MKKVSEVISFFRSICLLDFFVAAVCLTIAFIIHNLNFPSNFTPYLQFDIANPLRTNTIPDMYILIITIGMGSLVTVCLWLTKRADLTILKCLSAYLFAVTFADLVSSVLQYQIARPRPDTISVCGAVEECAQVLNGDNLRSQFRSLPSGNAAQSMAGALFLTLLFGQLWISSSLLSAILKFAPLCFALFVGAAEIWDRANHVDDVVFGYLIGAIIAFVGFNSFAKGIQKEESLKANPLGTDVLSLNPIRGY